MRWCILGFTSPTLLSGRKTNLFGSKNVGEVNPNVHHLILVSTLHTFLFSEFFCYHLFIRECVSTLCRVERAKVIGSIQILSLLTLFISFLGPRARSDDDLLDKKKASLVQDRS